VPRQQAVGKDAVMGTGEFADPGTPAVSPAPGDADDESGAPD
jgi:hypothetical protein